ncbi:MAG: rhodanese-like domain-containing protein [Gammaproteobacteria bacterium]
MNHILNISGYKFIQLNNLEVLQSSLKQLCQELALKGTILISAEGINICLAGSPENIKLFISKIHKDEKFSDIFFKESISEIVPFRKLCIKIKKEIITFGRPNIDTSKNQTHTVTPKVLKQWLDENKPVTLLDTRNTYEFLIGTFNDAVTLPIEKFTDLPDRLGQLTREQKSQPIVIFCTGGVRCEKVLPVMLEQGYQEVYQLDGGILNYFLECGDAHYKGDCFVFDDRIAISPQAA